MNKLDTITNNYLKIRTYNSAIYEKNVIKPAHYGLNINLYTHFTSPIRRICDIITHINIKNYKENKKQNLIRKGALCQVPTEKPQNRC